MLTLQNLVIQNQTRLGVHYKNLGSQKNLYLSYDRTTGWSLQRFSGCLGFFQKIFRSLGFYASTHLKNVREQLQLEPNVPPQLLDRINASWQKMHPRVLTIPEAIAAPLLPRIDEARVHLEKGPTGPHRSAIKIGQFPNSTIFSMESGDLLQAQVKAIVNPATPSLLDFRQGLNREIHNAAGPELLAECQNLPIVQQLPHPLPPQRCNIGQAVITRSGLLAQRGIERVLHAAIDPLYANPPAPVDPWLAQRRAQTMARLKGAYIHCLDLAHENGIRTIAFPPLGAAPWYPIGAGGDLKEATNLAVRTIMKYLIKNPGRFNEVKLIFIDAFYPAATQGLRLR